MVTQNYKTKTEYIRKDNGMLPGTWLIGIDIGYSAVKVFSSNSVSIFPAYARPYADHGTVGELPDEYISYKDLDTGETWLVGSMAQESVTYNEAVDSVEVLFGRDRYFDPMFKVIARVGLAFGMIKNKYGEIGGKKLCVQTGLPPAYIQDDSPYLREVLSGRHHFSVKIGNSREYEFLFDLPQENIFINLQPVGTLHSICTGDDRKPVAEAKEFLKKNILIYDVGFGTLDLFFVKGHRVSGTHSFSTLGMKQVFLNTADMIKEKYGQTVGIVEMQKYLATGNVRCFDRRSLATKDVPFGHLLELASDRICDEAIEKVAQIYPFNEIDCFVITGGTSAAWSEKIRARLSGMTTMQIIDGNKNTPSLPLVYANVRGYYMYRYNQLISKAQ